jgi:hypothetical protein
MRSTLKPDSFLSLHTVSFLEFIDTSAGINQFLLARKERVATAANIHFHNVALFGRSRFEGGTASADNRDFMIFRMYIGFHVSHLAKKCFPVSDAFPLYRFFLQPSTVFARIYEK